MHYDSQNDPFEDLNDPAVLDDTPIGTLRVVPWANVASVAVMDKDDPSRIVQIIHTLHEGENPLNAIYGKRAYEHADWVRAYAARDEAETKSKEGDAAMLSKDTIGELDKLERRRDDGAEAVAAAIGLVPWEVKG